VHAGVIFKVTKALNLMHPCRIFLYLPRMCSRLPWQGSSIRFWGCI